MAKFFEPLDPLLVGKRQAAQLLGVCARTVDKLIQDRTLPTRKVGARTLIPFSALVAFAGGESEKRTETREIA